MEVGVYVQILESSLGLLLNINLFILDVMFGVIIFLKFMWNVAILSSYARELNDELKLRLYEWLFAFWIY